MPYDPNTGIEFDAPGTVPEERGTIVTFEIVAKHMRHASELEGHPVYENREYVKIIQPGNRNTEIFREATSDDKRRWPVRYRQFKDDMEQIGTGTPLAQWPLLTPAMMMNLRGLGLRTIEDVADISDTNLAQLGMGARDLRTKAQAYLDKEVNGAELSKALAENAKLTGQMSVMESTMKALQAQVQLLLEAKNA